MSFTVTLRTKFSQKLHGGVKLVELTRDMSTTLVSYNFWADSAWYSSLGHVRCRITLDNVSLLGSFLHAFQSCSNISRMIPIRPVCYKFSIVHVKNTDLVCLSELFTQVLDIRALRRLSPTSKCLTRLDHVYFVGL